MREGRNASMKTCMNVLMEDIHKKIERENARMIKCVNALMEDSVIRKSFVEMKLLVAVTLQY